MFYDKFMSQGIMKNFPNAAPEQALWSHRREYFAYYVGQALGDEFGGSSTNQTRILELELERAFCAGAWVACIVLACAAGEVYLHAKGEKREAKFLKKYKLREEWMALEKLRNRIVHNSDELSYDEYMNSPDELEKKAHIAIQTALKVILLGTREELADSIKKDQT
ncbi:hypothetical protein AB3A37_003157 [Vibrio alginolyticus]|uniref:hypothetical protein n=1 Tax=Vibrio alginolyticus TaxID=663 RepID=UPI00280DB556|nr:hypothetical protein [Vibrio alginolyticus]ELB2737669.1 hypothetical protein [Vibrio alginolyticus]ELB2758654.1 hypothetical protein [Vibrio alginolyticus]